MQSSTYLSRRERLTHYFDHSAAAAWQALTSNAPVSRIRETVRQGRDEMRATLLSWLPADLNGCSLVDAGCGTGALAIEAASRGANVIAIDVAGKLIEVAKNRTPAHLADRIDYRVGDMLRDIPLSADFVVAMDSLIHYDADDILMAVERLSACAEKKIVITTAPWTPALALMHFSGRFVPRREDRAPAIAPVRTDALMSDLDTRLAPSGFKSARTQRVSSGFYKSQAIEVTRR